MKAWLIVLMIYGVSATVALLALGGVLWHARRVRRARPAVRAKISRRPRRRRRSWAPWLRDARMSARFHDMRHTHPDLLEVERHCEAWYRDLGHTM